MLCSYDNLCYIICTVLCGRHCVIQHSCCNTSKTIFTSSSSRQLDTSLHYDTTDLGLFSQLVFPYSALIAQIQPEKQLSTWCTCTCTWCTSWLLLCLRWPVGAGGIIMFSGKCSLSMILLCLLVMLSQNRHSYWSFDYNVDCESKKQDTILVSITLRNINKFSKLFHC